MINPSSRKAKPFSMNDADYRMLHALKIVRRYVDSRAALLPDGSGIAYEHHIGEKRLLPTYNADGTPFIVARKQHLLTRQFVRTKAVLSRKAALKLVAELSEE